VGNGEKTLRPTRRTLWGFGSLASKKPNASQCDDYLMNLMSHVQNTTAKLLTVCNKYKFSEILRKTGVEEYYLHQTSQVRVENKLS